MTKSFDEILDEISDSGDALGKVETKPWKPLVERVQEPCEKCAGTGVWRPTMGRIDRPFAAGKCFACNGTGKSAFKTSKDRFANRQKIAARKQDKQQAFIEAHKSEFEWVQAQARRQEDMMGRPNHKVWQFPIAMAEAFTKWGSWTDGQLAAIRNCMMRDEERKASKPTGVEVDLSKLRAAFDKARSEAAKDGEGVKWLRLHLDTFTFMDAPATPEWPAAIFVKEGDKKLGRITGGKFVRGFTCNDETAERVVAAATDPAKAAIAFGRRTGTCSCCGRELTNAESRKAGIGPICAEKFGF